MYFNCEFINLFIAKFSSLTDLKNTVTDRVQNLATKKKHMAICMHLSADLFQQNITYTMASAAWRPELLFQEIYPFTILL